MKKTRFWVALFAALLILSVLAAAVIYLFPTDGGVVLVTLNGERVMAFSPHEYSDATQMAIPGAEYDNILEIKNGRVRMKSAACPDQICVKHGWISNASRPIVCLPSKVVITFDGGKSGGIDGVSQ